MTAHFSDRPRSSNIGIQLGPKSGNLGDVDLDCIEAVALTRHFLPETGAIFGRKSNPASHFLYIVADPEPRQKIEFKDEAKAMMVELRLGGGGKGTQSLGPGSRNPEDGGEMVEWVTDGEPAIASCATLKRACSLIAAGSMIMRSWPAQKGRHDFALVVSGFLARAGWSVDRPCSHGRHGRSCRWRR